jgi:hypothetical protein
MEIKLLESPIVSPVITDTRLKSIPKSCSSSEYALMTAITLDQGPAFEEH